MYKLDKPLYHGTSAAAAVYICGGRGFNAPLYLTENKEAAVHYAKAATAYVEGKAKENGARLIKDGYAVFTFRSVPNEKELVIDDYSEKEPGQWKYLSPLRGLHHFTVELNPLIADEIERLYLQCFAIGMWRR
jgi:hypothetical protein